MCILITVNTYSQPFASFEGTTKGVAMTLGYQSYSGLQIAGGYNVPFTNSTHATLVYANVGYNYILDNEDQDNFSLTPTIGIAHSSVQVFDTRDNPITIVSVRPIYGMEFGKDWHMGRLFVSANYCQKFYYGIGIKAFFK